MSILANLRWQLSNLRETIAAARSRSNPRQQLQRLDRRCSMLRKLLRKEPRWIEGHLLLALAALERYRTPLAAPDARDLATANVSAEAITALADDQTPAAIRNSASALLAISRHYEKRFAEAFEQLRAIISDGSVQSFDETLRVWVFEYAGAAAMACGQNDTAKQYFSSIPAGLAGGEVEAALSYIEESERGDFEGAQSGADRRRET